MVEHSEILTCSHVHAVQEFVDWDTNPITRQEESKTDSDHGWGIIIRIKQQFVQFSFDSQGK